MVDYKNYFTFSSSVTNLLFKDLTVSSIGVFIGLCIGVAAFTFLYEAVKSLRHHLVIELIHSKSEPDGDISRNESQVPRVSLLSGRQKISPNALRKLKFHCCQTLLHMLQLTMGYMLMLIIMSYNAWLLITVLLTTAACFYFHEYILSRKPLVVPVEAPTL